MLAVSASCKSMALSAAIAYISIQVTHTVTATIAQGPFSSHSSVVAVSAVFARKPTSLYRGEANFLQA